MVSKRSWVSLSGNVDGRPIGELTEQRHACVGVGREACHEVGSEPVELFAAERGTRSRTRPCVRNGGTGQQSFPGQQNPLRPGSRKVCGDSIMETPGARVRAGPAPASRLVYGHTSLPSRLTESHSSLPIHSLTNARPAAKGRAAPYDTSIPSSEVTKSSRIVRLTRRRGMTKT